MNTAVARRLALGDRVVWVGKNDHQPSGPGTITRITAHQVEVLWEDETVRRYRRTQLHNLRHTKAAPQADWNSFYLNVEDANRRSWSTSTIWSIRP